MDQAVKLSRVISETGVEIDIDDNGLVNILRQPAKQLRMRKNIFAPSPPDPEVGAIYGTVKKVVDFGAFVEIRPGLEGLLHISQLDTKRVQKVEDVVKEKNKY